MALTKEQLTTPRYLLIEDYPHATWEKGTILNVATDGELYSVDHGWSTTKNRVFESDVALYPANFRTLAWWEFRKVEDMPEYVRFTGSGLTAPDKQGIYNPRWVMEDEPYFEFKNKVFSWGMILASECTPATEAEYLTYINGQK